MSCLSCLTDALYTVVGDLSVAENVLSRSGSTSSRCTKGRKISRMAACIHILSLLVLTVVEIASNIGYTRLTVIPGLDAGCQRHEGLVEVRFPPTP